MAKYNSSEHLGPREVSSVERVSFIQKVLYHVIIHVICMS